MENYIIRIYRREKENSKLFRGIVEEVGRAERRLFTNSEELWEILNPERIELAGEEGRE